MKPPFKILVFIPAWRRPEILEICLAGLQRLKKYKPHTFEIIPFFVVSESVTAYQLIKHRFDFVFFQNQPLGNKKLAGLRYVLSHLNFDYMLEMGSDDLLTNSYLDLAEPCLSAGEQQFCPYSVYFVDSVTGATAYWESERIIGLGRFIHRKAIEKVCNAGDYFWHPEKRRGMDTFSWRQLQKHGIGCTTMYETQHGIYALDIKSGENINTLEPFTRSQRSRAEILAAFPEGKLISKLITTSENGKQ